MRSLRSKESSRERLSHRSLDRKVAFSNTSGGSNTVTTPLLMPDLNLTEKLPAATRPKPHLSSPKNDVMTLNHFLSEGVSFRFHVMSIQKSDNSHT